ncbi:hypothetical protein MNBD_ALPHA06-420 [hydrothermal vent metagenome]|uniref:uroporphyrinogen-III synthase n=1 Tax=hydrothermal vent metagenome TaxID=652676 RepID=A0A3B0SBL9_9ZZZZ
MSRILITRTRPGADRLAKRLQEAGIQAVICPLLEVENLRERAALQPTETGLILTSVAALPGAPAPEQLAQKPVYCVGTETARQAAMAGYQNIVQGNGNGKNLAGKIARSTPDKTQNLLWCRGEVADETLVRKLQKQACSVRQYICYRTRKCQCLPDAVADDLATGKFDMVVFHSRRGSETFAALAPKLAASTRALAYSQNIADGLKTAGFAEILVCPQPNDLALLALLSEPNKTP